MHDRGKFLQDVADQLNGHEIGDGTVARAAKEAQRKYFDAPVLDHGDRSKYR